MTQAAFERGLIPSRWMKTESAQVSTRWRVGPATRSVLATSYTTGKGKGNLTAHRKGLRRFWLHCCDRRHALIQTYNNCAETHLGGGVLSPFVLPLITISVPLGLYQRALCPLGFQCTLWGLVWISLILLCTPLKQISGESTDHHCSYCRSQLWCHIRGDARAGNNNDAAKRYSVCERAHG